MDTFVDSSWYFLRYVSPDLETAPFDVDRANDWMPVDQYVGGIEHAVMHLLYSRFFTKVLADEAGLDHREPFENLLAQGMVQLDGEAMSKSKGNTVSPQRIVEEYGADTARLFMMQAAQPERAFDWTEEGVQSTRAFLDRLYDDVVRYADGAYETGEEADATAAYVRDEIDAAADMAADEYDDLTFNVAAREAQELARTLRGYVEYDDAPHGPTVERGLSVVLRLLAPVAPHVTEELWERLGDEAAASDASGEPSDPRADLLVDAPWPEPEGDTSDAAARRRLVENTREDVRDIVDVAGIDEPERIDVAVTPAWKHRALEVAIESDAPNVISEIMGIDEIRAQGDAAASYGQDLQANREALTRSLPPEREFEALERAAWLVEREFDAEVRVLTAEEAGDLAEKAEPGRPGIEIHE